MSLTRKKLTALGIESEKIDEIIEAHIETVNALKGELDEAKSKADGYDKIKAERDKLADEVKNLKDAKGEDDSYKAKYEELKDEYAKYKDGIKAETTKANKVKAYKQLLSEIGVSTKRIDSITKLADLNSVELDENGTIKDADKLSESLKNEWSDFIETKGAKSGAKSYDPPSNNGGSAKTREEILAIKDTAERQKAIAENIELFN